jgi:hypothetical protein
MNALLAKPIQAYAVCTAARVPRATRLNGYPAFWRALSRYGEALSGISPRARTPPRVGRTHGAYFPELISVEGGRRFNAYWRRSAWETDLNS